MPKKSATTAAASRRSAAPAKAAKASAAAGGIKPIKEAFSKSELSRYIAEQTGVEPKSVKAVLAALEGTILGAIHKKGVGQFTLPGIVKLTAQAVPAKKKRFAKDPFTGEERWFPAKPATVRVKARALKKLKDAAV
ncbi:HU family DNA-binding protein [Tahibacter amnicola]|uniref:HU family DNA-binding protein n=1 Tax=Tahibacter amnicola TaxID=2976241 RepID=A0ABY6BEJ5_9GAMM|nr:HU family DNA-binding protein [Tahibacter amnicola]UXI68279.1 HU family DNA-binding protein [Tahibacter amnicola]